MSQVVTSGGSVISGVALARPCRLLGIDFAANVVAAHYLLLWDQATVPTVGQGTPMLSIGVGGQMPTTRTLDNRFFGTEADRTGLLLQNGIAWAISLAPDTWNTTSITGANHTLNLVVGPI